MREAVILYALLGIVFIHEYKQNSIGIAGPLPETKTELPVNFKCCGTIVASQ